MRKVFLIVTIVVSCCLGACNSSTAKENSKTTDKNKQAIVDEKYLEWPKYLRETYCDVFEWNDPRELAIIDQIEDVYLMVADTTVDAELFCKSLSRLITTLRNEIKNNTEYFGFTNLLRATAIDLFYSSGFFGYSFEEISAFLENKCGCIIPYDDLFYMWSTSADKEIGQEIMTTTCFAYPEYAMRHFVRLTLSSSDFGNKGIAELMIVNMDTTNYDVKFTFEATEGSILFTWDTKDIYKDSSNKYIICDTSYLMNNNDIYKNSSSPQIFVDTTQYNEGMLRILFPIEPILDLMTRSNLVIVELQTSQDLQPVEIYTYAPLFFDFQIVMRCPMLMEVMNKVKKEQNIQGLYNR